MTSLTKGKGIIKIIVVAFKWYVFSDSLEGNRNLQKRWTVINVCYIYDV